VSSESATPGIRPYSLVVFGDSWPYGAHCSGCTPWPKLLAPAYQSALGVQATLVDLTENGGTSGSLLEEFRTSDTYRDAITKADIVVINMGLNDLESSTDQAVLKKTWSKNLEALASTVDELRAKQPTALRMVGVSNEYLTDGGLTDALGGSDAAAKIFATFNQVSCKVAEKHSGQCVDLRPVLNGPDGKTPADPNTQESMQRVADAIVAKGLNHNQQR